MEMIVGISTELDGWRCVMYVIHGSTCGVSIEDIDERVQDQMRHTTFNRPCVQPWIIEGELNHRRAQETTRTK
jgi:hypothetical protein